MSEELSHARSVVGKQKLTSFLGTTALLVIAVREQYFRAEV